MQRSEEILDYWFGQLSSDQDFPDDRAKLWFSKNDDTDSFIRDSFEIDVQAAAQGKLEDWKETARGNLAWIILLDQFTRNIYRGQPEAFASDPLALAASLAAQERGFDQQLRPLERLFVYLPMEHAEDRTMQQKSVHAFERLLEACPPGLEVAYDSFRDYAVRHLKIIEQFGRFPHRNTVLGRASTPEEEEFLKQPGSGF